MIELSRAQRPDGRLAVASRAQESFWFLHRLVPDAPTGIGYRMYHVTGPLDVGALRTAWRELIRRHEVLRSTVAEYGGRVRLRINGWFDEPFTTASMGPVAADRWCVDRMTTPMDLATGPLARLAVLDLGDHRHRIVLFAHRAVADDRSMSIIMGELSACYAAALAGRDPATALPTSTAQYPDYALWQRDRLAAPEFHRHLDWWLATCTPPPGAPSLPTDRERPAGPSWRGNTVRFDWGTPLTVALTALATAHRTTADMVVLAGFQVLLARYSGIDRVAVAVAQRPDVGFDRLVGPCAGPVPLIVDLAGAPTTRDLLDRLVQTATDVLEHAELPIGELARALRLDRDPRRLPLADLLFLPPGGDTLPEFAGTDVSRRYIDAGSAATDLTLTVDHLAPSLTGSLTGRASLLESASVRAILAQLRTLLTAAVADPDRPVADLPLADTDAIVSALDQITAADPPDQGGHELVRAAARRHPDAVAVAWPGETLTYRDLVRRADGIAAELGDVHGRPVAVRIGPGPELVAAVLGVLAAGAHVVCFGPTDTGERAVAMLEQLRPARMLVAAAPTEDRLVSWYQQELSGQVVDVGTVEPADALGAPVRSDALAYVAYTSGSTGAPKGIAQSHATLTQFVTWFGQRFGLGPGVRLAQWAAPGYDAGLCEVFAALTSGATLCPVPADLRANPDKLVTWLVAERITVLQTVPSFARELLRVISASRAALRPHSLSHLLLAGEALPGELANGLRAALPWISLVNLYGPTEAILATWYPITGDLGGTAPIGEPIPGRQVVVLDERDRPCPPGVTGHIAIRSPYLVSSYVGRPDTDAFAAPAGLPVGNWYRTGDLGRLRWDGQLEFRGRIDFQVKLLGTRMELSDIEATLAGHESIGECAVLPVRGPDGLVGKLVAHVVPVGSAGSARVWRARLRQRFGTTLLPVAFTVHSAPLPRNVGGKIDRRLLRDADVRSGQDVATPRTVVERDVAALWTGLTGVAVIELSDTFCGIGGDSLLVPRMLHLVRDRFGVEGITLWDYFAGPSLAELAAAIDAAPARRHHQHQGTTRTTPHRVV